MEDFDPIIDRFSKFDCLMLDTRGHGGSTLGDKPLSYPLLAQDAETVVREHGMSKPFIVGHSDGGIAALHIAARKALEVSGLVTIGSRAYPPPSELLDKVYRPLTAEKWQERFPDWVKLYEKLNPRPDFGRLFEAVKAMWIDESAHNYPFAALGEIDIRALILCGDADHLVSRDQTLALAKALPNAALGLFPFGSHVFHQEHPELTAPFILKFIEDAFSRAEREAEQAR
jgi:pimeloyl-ACP methyl ester carboxylesterase